MASELALLFEAARDSARAADYFVLAAQNAARVYANQEAVVLLGRALANAENLQGEAGPAHVLAIALHRARLFVTLSQFEDAIADFELAEKLANETANGEAQINALCGKAMPLLTFDGSRRRRSMAVGPSHWPGGPNPAWVSPPQSWFSPARERMSAIWLPPSTIWIEGSRS